MPAESNSGLYLGMLSGTSRDGVDVSLVSFGHQSAEIGASACYPYPGEVSEALTVLVNSDAPPDRRDLADLDHALGVHFANSALGLLSEAGVSSSDIVAIGSHGQTVWHEPPQSVQLGDPNTIASRTGITTIADFRRADLEVGGEGAPLAPLLHAALFRPEAGTRAVLNLGGIANISLVGADATVRGFDTGPGNCLMDAWIRRDRQLDFDDDGSWAEQGTVIQPVLMALLEDPYFSRMAPKSTGVEYFNLRWLESRTDVDAFEPVDIQATLADLTARSVVDALADDVSEVLVCGGGVHNAHLMSRLNLASPERRFCSTAEFGLDPDSVESVLFAWLARERLEEREQDTTTITGASRAVLLGSIYLPV